MKIGLIADNTKTFPSLPLMKLSAYYKNKGDIVEFAEAGTHYDIVYVSKTFNLNLSHIPKIALKGIMADKIISGGTGYEIKIKNGREIYEKCSPDLPEEMEHIYPDYSLYPDLTKDTAYGFLTRGCPNNCPFCIVSKKEGFTSQKVANLSEFWSGQKNIKLLDANLLACKEKLDLIKQLEESKAYIDYTQGIDARFITEEIAKALCKTKIKLIHFAFDLMKNEKNIIKGLEIFKNISGKSDRHLKCYILVNYNTTYEEDLYRVKKVIELGYRPDVRIYQKPSAPQFIKDLARWANNDIIYRSCKFAEYVPRSDGKRIKDLYNKY